MVELKFKLGDLVMYANKVDTNADSVRNYFMKPAKIIGFQNHEKYPYEIQLLENEHKTNYFNENELIRIATTKEQLDAMVIRNEITEETYEKLIKTIEV